MDFIYYIFDNDKILLMRGYWFAYLWELLARELTVFWCDSEIYQNFPEAFSVEIKKKKFNYLKKGVILYIIVSKLKSWSKLWL